MNANRNFIVVTCILAICLIAGGTFLFVSSQPSALEATAPAMGDSKSTTRDATLAKVPPQTDAEMARLRQENELLKTQLDNTRAELSRAKQQAALAQPATDGTPDAEAEVSVEYDANAESTGLEEGDDKKLRRKDKNKDRGGWSEERAAEFRAGVDQFYEEALASADTPEAQDRIASIRDYSQQMMDLRQQIRSVEDDKVREALRAEMETLRDEMQPLVRDQQDYLLRQAATAAGVTSEGTQNHLNRALRETLRSPFFMPGFAGGRGGPGAPGGGRGPGGQGGGGAQ